MKLKLTMNRTKFNNRGSAAELLLVVIVVALVGVGFYLYQQRSSSRDLPKPLPPEIRGGEVEVQPTVYPTLAPLKTDSSDETINTVSGEVNDLMGELNELDQIEADLSFPEIDFSLGF